MHNLQRKLLTLIDQDDLSNRTLSEIAQMVDGQESSPQRIQHHLAQLEKKGLITIDRVNRSVSRTKPRDVTGFLKTAELYAIPIMGSGANAGPATLAADNNVQGYLRLSSSVLRKGQDPSKLFALKVMGNSMNRASIAKHTIDDGDYVVIDSSQTTASDGDVVISVISGNANIKRFRHDKLNKQILLLSESTSDYPPIIIGENDDYVINGKVIQVIKMQRSNDG